MTEAEFLAAVKELAAYSGWLCYHTHDSRRSDPGFPDLVLVRGGTLIFAELKSKYGRVSAEQKVWLNELAALDDHREMGSGPNLEVVVWRPADWPRIEALLTPRRWESPAPERKW